MFIVFLCSSASEVTTVWRYRNSIIIIIIIYIFFYIGLKWIES